MENETSIAYLINSTPKYYYILELHLVLLKRYAPNLKWQVFLATEEPEHLICKKLVSEYGVQLIVLEKENTSFLTSRKRALELLPSHITKVFPIQEDFLLERFIDEDAINESIQLLDKDDKLIAVRYMPCPGPNEKNNLYKNSWLEISEKYDTYGFCFQATLWKRDFLQLWYNSIVLKCEEHGSIDRKRLEVDMNISENVDGQKLFYSLFKDYKQIGWKRAHKYSNAVYMCPWPYRPTAIIRGVLQPFAKELAEREGVKLSI
jgi:hypothetical protein